MERCRTLLVPIVLAALAAPAPAGVLFGRKEKPNPAERVPELLGVLKTSQDEHKRASAAEELRQYDTTAFPAIVPAVIEALLQDPKAAVRAEAAETLGKLRPVSQQAGLALEHALAQDSSMRVRLQARYALLSYHWAGYHSPKKGEKPEPPNPPQTGEPPLADPAPPMIQTAPPAASPPRLTPAPAGAPPVPFGAAKPLPGASPPRPAASRWPAVTTEPPRLRRVSTPADEGPDLGTPPE